MNVRLRALGRNLCLLFPGLVAGAFAAAACAPAAQPGPTTPPARPAPTVASAGPEAKPAATAAPAKPAATQPPAARPAEKPDLKAIEEFYQGKTIRIIVGYSAGGGFDTYARTLARHLGSHLPGNPTAVVENVPGAGSLKAANQLFKLTKPDGLTFGTFNEFQLLSQLTGQQGVEFDARQFSWVGSSYTSHVACVARKDTGLATFQDLLKASQPFVVGGTAPGSETDDFPRVLRATTGAKLKLVSGYEGTSKIRLAVESREVDGACWSWQSIKSTAQQWLDEKYVNVLVQQSREGRHPDLKEIPVAEEFARDDAGRQALRAWAAPQAMSKPFAAPPGVPAERLAALQQAFMATFKDPAFLDDARKANLDVEPKAGPQVLEVAREVLSAPPGVARKLAEALKAE
ncbi:MAG: hypothetical protein HY690_10735 [Chloroflexi bacterium]|nr:hypothetical protein [Chloroflexota bacterium]